MSNYKFSLNYGDAELSFDVTKGTVFELENGVTATVVLNSYKKFDAVEWVVCYENTNQVNSKIISNINDCDTLLKLDTKGFPKSGYMPGKGDPCIITMNGCINGDYYYEKDKLSSTEFNFNKEYLLGRSYNKTKRFASKGGRSSDGIMPFFDVTSRNEGCIIAIGWSGDWKSEFSRTEDGINVKTGLKNTAFYLKPGEKVRTSSTLVMKYSSVEDKHNKFRKLIKTHFSHKSASKNAPDGLMAMQFWGGLKSERMKTRLAEIKEHKIKFDQLWIDAGWYGKSENSEDTFSGDWPEWRGDWSVNEKMHPMAFQDVKECAKDADMGFMLWFEPEVAQKHIECVNEHPDRYILPEGKYAAMLNYGNQEAYQYIYDIISTHIRNLDIKCYRQDFNIEPAEYFENQDEQGRRGITEIKHIMGMYRLLDELHKLYPELLIDNCASGGRRIDIEMLKRSIVFFRSDYQCNFNANPEVVQVHNSNISKYLPYIGCTTKSTELYDLRSSYSTSWGCGFYAAVWQEMSEEDFANVKFASDEYRKIRKYFSKDFYNLGSDTFDDTSWAVWQYHDEDSQSGIIMAFRRSNSPFKEILINLKGLSAGERYIYTNLNDGESFEASDEMSIVLPEKRTSVIFEYRIKQ